MVERASGWLWRARQESRLLLRLLLNSRRSPRASGTQNRSSTLS